MIVADVGFDTIPDNCTECQYSGCGMCAITGGKIYDKDGYVIHGDMKGRDSDCPLMELKPTKTHYDKDGKPIIKGYLQYV